MEESVFRGIVMGSFTLLGVVLASVILEWAQTGTVATQTLIQVSVVLIGLLVLLSYAVQARPRPDANQCICGKQRFETIRSADRRHVLTCFGCGRESILQVPETVRTPRRPSGI